MQSVQLTLLSLSQEKGLGLHYKNGWWFYHVVHVSLQWPMTGDIKSCLLAFFLPFLFDKLYLHKKMTTYTGLSHQALEFEHLIILG